jgi:Uma2 family endonuclease
MADDKQEQYKSHPKKIKEAGLTYEDYAKLPDDGNRYEISDGVLELLAPSPSSRHQSFSGELEFLLKQSCKQDYIILSAPIDLILSDKQIRQPDILMIHRSKRDIIEERGIVGAPDLIVEIISPSSVRRDKITKKKIYSRYGIREYWILDPVHCYLEQYLLEAETDSERTVSESNSENHSYFLNNVFVDEDIVTSPHIPCISFKMKDLDTL